MPAAIKLPPRYRQNLAEIEAELASARRRVVDETASHVSREEARNLVADLEHWVNFYRDAERLAK